METTTSFSPTTFWTLITNTITPTATTTVPSPSVFWTLVTTMASPTTPPSPEEASVFGIWMGLIAAVVFSLLVGIFMGGYISKVLLVKRLSKGRSSELSEMLREERIKLKLESRAPGEEVD